MSDSAAEVDFELDLTFNPEAPEELHELGRRYWQVDGINAYTNSIEWVYKTADLDYQLWSGSAHYAAAAAVVAASSTFACRTCGGVLTLASRQTLTDARRGQAKDCRACDRVIEVRAAAVLDPKSLAKREQRAEKKRIDDEFRAQKAAEDEARRELTTALEEKRRAAIRARYPGEIERDGGYAMSRASLVAKVGALAAIHAAGKPGGLIHPIRLNDQTLAPNYRTSEDLFLAAWRAGLVLVHPSSATDAFEWDDGDEAALGDGLHVDRARFAAPGEGPLGPRLAAHTEYLRGALRIEHLSSTDRRELELLSRALVAEEAIRYFRYLIRDHSLPDPAEEHEARLRSHAQKIQVKSARGPRVEGISWPLGTKSQGPSRGPQEFFVMVAIPHDLTMPARSFIVPRIHVAAAAWIEHMNWLTEPGIPQGQRNAAVDRARVAMPTFAAYEDRWDLLLDEQESAPVLLPPAYRTLALDPRVGLPPEHEWRHTLPSW